jgi:TrmH family RNA methyltransferase
LPTDARLVVLLANVRDPGNAGSVIRVADAAGASGVLVSTNSVDVYNSKAVRASAGSLFHVPVACEVDIQETIAQARSLGIQVFAADGSGEPFTSGVELSKPTMWVFGNEAWGLPQEILELVDQVVSIPIYGKAESLNLATAAALCLYASANALHS